MDRAAARRHREQLEPGEAEGAVFQLTVASFKSI